MSTNNEVNRLKSELRTCFDLTDDDIQNICELVHNYAEEDTGTYLEYLHDVEDKDSIPKDICTLRKLFYKDKGIV